MSCHTKYTVCHTYIIATYTVYRKRISINLQYLEYEIVEQYINYHHQFFDEVKVDLDILTDLKE